MTLVELEVYIINDWDSERYFLYIRDAAILQFVWYQSHMNVFFKWNMRKKHECFILRMFFYVLTGFELVLVKIGQDFKQFSLTLDEHCVNSWFQSLNIAISFPSMTKYIEQLSFERTCQQSSREFAEIPKEKFTHAHTFGRETRQNWPKMSFKDLSIWSLTSKNMTVFFKKFSVTLLLYFCIRYKRLKVSIFFKSNVYHFLIWFQLFYLYLKVGVFLVQVVSYENIYFFKIIFNYSYQPFVGC